MKEYEYMNVDTGEILTYEEMLEQWRDDYDGDDETNCLSIKEQYLKLKPEKVGIGIGHLIRAMQLYPFGHEEIMAMRKAMLTGDFSGIEFCEDCYTEEWKN